HAFHLEQDAPGTDDADPLLRRAFALAHARFLRLLGDRFVGEHAHPDLAAAGDEARHRDARRLDLAVGQPAGLERLQPVVAERHVAAAPRLAAHAAALLLAELDLLRHQHNLNPEGWKGGMGRKGWKDSPILPILPIPPILPVLITVSPARLWAPRRPLA